MYSSLKETGIEGNQNKSKVDNDKPMFAKLSAQL